MGQDEIGIRFIYHAPKEGQTERYKRIRDIARSFAVDIDELCV